MRRPLGVKVQHCAPSQDRHKRPIGPASIRTLNEPHLRPGARWGPNRLGAGIYCASSEALRVKRSHPDGAVRGGLLARIRDRHPVFEQPAAGVAKQCGVRIRHNADSNSNHDA